MILQPSGVSMDYASIPTALTELDDKMSFMQRMINTLQAELVSLFTDWFVMQPLEKRLRLDMPDARPLLELRGEASLLMINSHPATDWPRQLPPSVIPIGALHTRPAKPLPEVYFFKYCIQMHRMNVMYSCITVCLILLIYSNLNHLSMKQKKV